MMVTMMMTMMMTMMVTMMMTMMMMIFQGSVSAEPGNLVCHPKGFLGLRLRG